MRRLCTFLVAGLLLSPAAHGVVVGVADGSSPWQGFMNVFELPLHGGGYVFGSSWGVADLTANFDDVNHKLSIGPNTIGDPNPFWYTPSGGPGAMGNKMMDANLYIEVNDGSLSGQSVTFQGTVLSNTFLSTHATTIFIKDFAPDFSSSITTTLPVTPGNFSITLNTIAGAGRHVQYGFETIGPDVWATDVAPYGNVMIQTIPAPASLALLGLGGSMMFRRRR